ncbi:MAG: energy transducer TonB [Puniceicoccaceae bacterium]|nr:MAG: energy transducer TonB [Puniceicoccaceae bacterium]
MRLIGSLCGALVVVLGLFMAMQMMVSGDRRDPLEITPPQPIEFIRLQRDDPLQTIQRRIPEKPPPPETPPPPQLDVDIAETPQQQDLRMEMPNIDLSFRGTGGAVFSGYGVQRGSGDSGLIPLVRVAPQYPQQAAVQGIEGWVRVGFTITPEGTVQQPRVLESSPRGVFESAALRAILRWRFQPKIEGGVAVAQRAEQILTFNLED